MTFTITLGSWVIPAIISLFIYALAVCWCRGGNGDWIDFTPIVNLFKLGLATVIVLVVWLVYALAT